MTGEASFALRWSVAVSVIIIVGLLYAKERREQPQTAPVSLTTYSCRDFLTDVAKPNDAERLLRSLMMVSWATGFAASYEGKGVRADQAAFKLVATSLGDICRAQPQAPVVAAFVSEVSKLVNAKTN